MGFLGGSKADSKENRLWNNRAREDEADGAVFCTTLVSSDLPKGLLENNPVFINEGGTISELSLSRANLNRASNACIELLLRDAETGWMRPLDGCYARRATCSLAPPPPPPSKISRWCWRVTRDTSVS